MPNFNIVSSAIWLAARKELLATERVLWWAGVCAA